MGLVSVFLLLGLPGLSIGQSNTGRIQGTIFAKDGTSPYPGAVVTVKNIATQVRYKNVATDNKGVFAIEGLPKGMYVFGIKTPEGTFNSSDLIGVEPGKTSKISIALTKFDGKTASAAHEIYQEQKKTGEALVGKIIGFDRPSKMALVFLNRGFVNVGDKLHVVGESTSFFQDLNVLKLAGKSIKRAFAGQTVSIQCEYNARPNDLVFVVCKKGGFPLFLMPLGVAAIVAGTGAIVKPCTTTETEEVSTFRKKK